MDDRSFACPVEATLRVLGGKWKPVILWHLQQEGVLRFGELARRIPAVTKKMLTQQLRELEADGVVRREVFAAVPPRVEYALTGRGTSLGPVLEAMSAWGEEYMAREARRDDAA